MSHPNCFNNADACEAARCLPSGAVRVVRATLGLLLGLLELSGGCYLLLGYSSYYSGLSRLRAQSWVWDVICCGARNDTR